MQPQKRKATHPGKILLEEYLNPLNLSLKHFSQVADISYQALKEIVQGSQPIEKETAISLSKTLNTSIELWINLQKKHTDSEDPK